MFAAYSPLTTDGFPRSAFAIGASVFTLAPSVKISSTYRLTIESSDEGVNVAVPDELPSTVTVTGADVDEAPLLSIAVTTNEYAPAAPAVQSTLNGAAVREPISVDPQ